MRFLLKKGSLYKIYNRNLLYHGCIPLNEDGSFKEVEVYGKVYKGKALYDILETYVRKAFVAIDKEEKEKGRDILWFIWAGSSSPFSAKIRWLLLRDAFWRKKRPMKKRKIPIIVFWKTIRL